MVVVVVVVVVAVAVAVAVVVVVVVVVVVMQAKSVGAVTWSAVGSTETKPQGFDLIGGLAGVKCSQLVHIGLSNVCPCMCSIVTCAAKQALRGYLHWCAPGHDQPTSLRYCA